MAQYRILFIGGGNMAQAMVGGLVADNQGWVITVLDRHPEKRALLENKYGVSATAVISATLFDVDMIVFAIKPQNARETCLQLEPFLRNKNIVMLSVMTGVTIDTLQAWLGGSFPVVRAMPNTPALIGAAATGLFANTLVSPEQKQYAESIFSVMGIIAWLENEAQIDAIIALSGSGPAYFFLMMESMQSAAIALGLSEEIAKKFAVQTAYGASLLALKSNETAATLRSRVTSKGGTTQAAIAVFEDNGFASLVHKAMCAAKERGEAIASSL